MTVDEKRNLLEQWCSSNNGCKNCPASGVEPLWCDTHNENTIPEDKLDTFLNTYVLDKPEEIEVEEVHSTVDHPIHYNRDGAMECIDEMVLVFGKEAVKHFCICNIWKYRYRASDKNGSEDMEKSHWYMKKYEELCQ